MFTWLKKAFLKAIGGAEREEIIRKFTYIEKQINRLPHEKAERFAYVILQNSVRWHVEKAEALPGCEEIIAQMGPGTQRLFRNFSYIQDLDSNFYIGHKSFEIHGVQKPYITIGRDMGSDYLIVPAGSDVLYSSCQQDGPDDEEPVVYPSIYHLLIYFSVIFEDWTLEAVFQELQEELGAPESE